MKKKSTALAPIETVNNSVQPKPTKNEVIQALALVRLNEIKANYSVASEKRKGLRERIDKEIQALVVKTIKGLRQDINLCDWKGVKAEITINLMTLPHEIDHLIQQLNKINLPKMPDEAALRKEIREALSTTGPEDRVNALISDPGTRNALERMLIDLGISENSKAIEAA
jgi:hypothetical protein